jgi:ABC-type multidrug transport system ATPase subunit
VPGRDTVLAIDGVRHRFERRAWVLDGIELELPPGTVTVVVGANGSGKSTLLRIVCGLQAPTAGRVRRAGLTLAYAPDRLSSRARMSARAYLEHVARLRRLDPETARSAAAAMGEELGVVPGLDAPMRDLSKGNTQKIALIQALLPPVDVVVLDEPYSGLDGAARGAVAQRVADQARRGAAVLVAAHNPLADLGPAATLRLDDGRLRADETAAVILMRVVLQGGALDRARLAAFAGVVDLARNGDHDDDEVVVRVASDASDAFLAAALLDGWSVRSLQPDAAPPPDGRR